jgi:hypothetical protein
MRKRPPLPDPLVPPIAVTRPRLVSSSTLRKEAAHWKQEIALQMLGKGLYGKGSNLLTRAFADPRGEAGRRLRAANLMGFGFGAKESKGQLTGELAIRVYVSGKRAKSKLHTDHLVPPTLGGMLTDVISVPRAYQHDILARSGTRIHRSNEIDQAGSLGFFISRNGSDKTFLVSASHVLAPEGAATGDIISATWAPDRQLARLQEFVPLVPAGPPNLTDAAIAEVLDRAEVEVGKIPNIGPVGTPSSIPRSEFVYQSVRKFGGTTFHTLGVVVDISANIPIMNFATGVKFHYADLVTVTGCGGRFSEGGDSGSLVVDALSNTPLGIVTGGSGFQTFITPIDRILTQFSAKLLR